MDAMLVSPGGPAKAVEPISAVAEGEGVWRPRGRPAGSRNKPKLPVFVARDCASVLRAHAMEVGSGCDVGECLAGFARRRGRGVCVLSGSGCLADVMLLQPGAAASSGSVVTLHGRFEILKLLGSVLPAPPGIGGGRLTVYLAGAQGRVVGGAVAGALVASGPVVIMAASFVNVTFDRLPLEGEAVDVPGNAARKQQHCQDPRHHLINISDTLGVPRDFLSEEDIPPEVYSWASGGTLTKN